MTYRCTVTIVYFPKGNYHLPSERHSYFGQELRKHLIIIGSAPQHDITLEIFDMELSTSLPFPLAQGRYTIVLLPICTEACKIPDLLP